jgi:hypothetical protein
VIAAAATGVAAAALSVSPVRIRLTRSVAQTITVTNVGASTAAVLARPAGFAIGPRGRPVVAPKGRQAGRWLRLRPRRLVLAPGERAVITLSSTAPRSARPGDHAALVLLTTQPRRTDGVAIRMQVGVVVLLRVAGRIVHRLELGPLKLRHRVLEAAVENRGNAAEITPVRVSLSRGGRVLARLRTAARTWLPHSRGTVRLRCPVSVRGWMTAQVQAGRSRRSFRIRP